LKIIQLNGGIGLRAIVIWNFQVMEMLYMHQLMKRKYNLMSMKKFRILGSIEIGTSYFFNKY